MTAPTEAEIRAAARRHLARVLKSSELIDAPWVYDLSEPLRYTATCDEDGVRGGVNRSLWDDLRPTQDARLRALVDDIYSKTDALMAEAAERVIEYVVEAGLTFAAEHPDAPRAKRETVAA